MASLGQSESGLPVCLNLDLSIFDLSINSSSILMEVTSQKVNFPHLCKQILKPWKRARRKTWLSDTQQHNVI